LLSVDADDGQKRPFDFPIYEVATPKEKQKTSPEDRLQAVRAVDLQQWSYFHGSRRGFSLIVQAASRWSCVDVG